MFDNIGSKVKTMASVFCIIGIIAYMFLGFHLMARQNFIYGLVVILLGALFSWLSTLALYAIGHIADNTDLILKKLNNKATFRVESPESPAADIPKATPYKKPETPKGQSNGSWWCSCGASNRDTDSSCSVCFKQRPNKK